MPNAQDAIRSLMADRPCCTLATVRITELADREKLFFAKFKPLAVTAIVLAHHITLKDEWLWHADGRGEEHCPADDHLRFLCTKIQSRLSQAGHGAWLVNYPGESGLQFRPVAQAAGLGAIGTNAFLFHPAWGPWVHLRVMATTAVLELPAPPAGDKLCNQCGACIPACPAKAITENSFAGLRCRAFRSSRGEYRPHGPRRLLPYCQRCICLCPQGRRLA